MQNGNAVQNYEIFVVLKKISMELGSKFIWMECHPPLKIFWFSTTQLSPQSQSLL